MNLNLDEVLPQGLVSAFPCDAYGHKRKLLRQILSLIPAWVTSGTDIFGCTSIVGWALKRAGLQVSSNDIMRHSYLRQRVFVANNSILLSEKDIAFLLERNPAPESWARDAYLPFMGEQNCDFIDNWAANVQRMEPGMKRDIATLLPVLAFSKATNGNRCALTYSPVGVLTGGRNYFGVSLQDIALDFARNILPRLIYDNGCENVASRVDALDFAEKTSADVVYADFPYACQSSAYEARLSMLDDLVQIVSGRGHEVKYYHDACADLPPYADFVSRRNAIINIPRVFSRLQHIPIWIVSYNTTSAISDTELKAMAEAQGRQVEMHYVDYARPTTRKSGVKTTKEILMVCK